MFFLGFSRRTFVMRGTASFIRNAKILRGEHAVRLYRTYQQFRASMRTPSQPPLRMSPRCHKTGCPTSIPTRGEAARTRRGQQAGRSCSVKLLFGE